LRQLNIPAWLDEEITPDALRVRKVSGSLTNAVFFVSCPSVPKTPTLLLRIYGPSSDALISRPRELRTLHALSSQYRIGPRVYGTFQNGRVEEYFDSVTLSPTDLRDPKMSRLIGARMAELHSVDISVVEEDSVPEGEMGGLEAGLGVMSTVKSWVAPARQVLALPSFPDESRTQLDIDRFEEEWKSYMRWVSRTEKTEGPSRRVFSHNDAQAGNLLRLTKPKEGGAEHRQIIVVDFEYASPNPAAFDIANHFNEWTSDYQSATPHILNPSMYPNLEQRRNFYRAYLDQSLLRSSAVMPEVIDAREREVELQKLDSQVRTWSPASHGMWAIWALVQAREDIEGQAEEVEFDYVRYAECRMEGFRREIAQLNI